MSPLEAVSKSVSIPARFTNLQKAAILLIAVSQEKPDLVTQIYRKLNKKYIRFIVQEVSKLNYIDKLTMNDVLTEFYEIFVEKSQLFGGKNVANTIISDVFGAEEAQQYFQSKSEKFNQLNRMSDGELYTFIHEEHPQFIALVLSSIDAIKSSNILSRFHEKDRIDITRRILNMENPIMPVHEIERALERFFTEREIENMSVSLNVQKVASILDDIPESERANIMSSIEADDPVKIKEIRKLLFSFSDFQFMPDSSIQYIVGEMKDIQLLAVALTNSGPELYNKITKNISSRMQTILQEEVQFLQEDLSLNEIEKARRSMIQAAKAFGRDRNLNLNQMVAEGQKEALQRKSNGDVEPEVVQELETGNGKKKR